MLFRPVNAHLGREIAPGDVLAGGENITSGALTTVGAGTWLGSAVASGIIRRTGPTGAYTDTTPTAAQIIEALKGGMDKVDATPGTSFRLLFQNTVAYAMTWAAGTGIVTGTGTLDVAASLVREYLVTILNSGPEQSITGTTVNGSPLVVFDLPVNAASIQQPSAYGNVGVYDITPGMSVSGTGVAAGATVTGITQGVGGMLGVKLSANCTADGSTIALSFGPTVRFDGLRSSTL